MKNYLKFRIASLMFDGTMLELIPEAMEKRDNSCFLTISGVEFCLRTEMIGTQALYCMLSVRNTADSNSPRIQNVNSFDCTFDSLEAPVLTSLTGDSCLDHGQMQYETRLPDGFLYIAEPTGGRSSNTTAFPYFNITDAKRSRVFAIGWSGQWRTTVSGRALSRYTVTLPDIRTSMVLEYREI